jgi:hypothetical protein
MLALSLLFDALKQHHGLHRGLLYYTHKLRLPVASRRAAVDASSNQSDFIFVPREKDRGLLYYSRYIYYIGPVIRHNHSVVTIELLNVPSSNLYQTLTMYSRLVLQPIHETFGGIVPSKPVRYFTECRVTACRSSNASISVNATPTRRDATPVHASFSSTSKPLRFCIRNQDTKCIGRSTLWKV